MIGALAARAEFSVERLSDTVLLGRRGLGHAPEDFPEGLVSIAIRDGDGTLDVRVGPMVEGGGERILAEMDLPGGEGGSLRSSAGSMEIVSARTDGRVPRLRGLELVSRSSCSRTASRRRSSV